MTQSQLLQLAQTVAQQQLSPLRQDISAQQDKARQDAASRADMIRGLYAAAAEMSKSAAPQIQQTYQQAADSTAGYGKGYSDQFRQSENQAADQSNALLQKWGNAPTVQGDKGGADVLYGLGGSIPAAALQKQGAAFSSAASFLPTTSLLRGAQEVAASGYNASRTNQDFVNQLTKLDATYPGVYNEVLSRLQTQQAQDAQTAAQAQGLRYNHALAIYQATGRLTPQIAQLLGIPQGTKTLAQQQLAAQTAAAAAKAKAPNAALSKLFRVIVDSNGNAIPGPDGKAQTVPGANPSAPKANASLSRALHYVVDDLGNPILRGGRKIPVPVAPGTAKAKKPLGLSAKDYSKQTSLALGAARTYHTTWQDKNGADQQPLTWQEYLTHGLNAGIDPRVLVKQGRRVYSQREIKLGLIPKGK